MNSAIIVAAGKGARMGGEDTPKQFRLLANTPLIIHTLRRFEDAHTIGEIIVVVAETQRADFLQIASRYNLRKLKRIVAGGATRGESVWRGLQNVRPATAGIIAVHDGARPFVTSEEIDKTIEAARETGAAILARPATDTIKRIENESVVETLPRATIYQALTPQCFRYDVLMRAYEQAKNANDFAATDDSDLVERTGVTVRVVECSPRNIKITHAEDWWLAEKLLAGDGRRGTGDR
ncbi:MAG: 2-C-methyl-D-erythritol 4-phosphate cytidylyltransferase [Pyrinomonadaceae bacterium MAG19_C2-C3]|nr:2-C-methyl-D-erythritol 4-phosphate cytidylyltransferase [Pyrinomonadaceae bacterium MAG19_C2-C3]